MRVVCAVQFSMIHGTVFQKMFSIFGVLWFLLVSLASLCSVAKVVMCQRATDCARRVSGQLLIFLCSRRHNVPDRCQDPGDHPALDVEDGVSPPRAAPLVSFACSLACFPMLDWATCLRHYGLSTQHQPVFILTLRLYLRYFGEWF